jgi:thiol-disulfide isomerase/thioredoxin
VFDTLLNYKKEKLALADLKGKFVIIDIFGTFCLPCIKDIPKIERFQKKFGDSLQILMVATDGFEKARQLYETKAKGNDPLYLPCAINRNLVNYFQVKEVSTYVWIDDQGYIKAISNDSQMTEQNVADFVNRKALHIRPLEKFVGMDYKKDLVSCAREIDSSTVLYSSTLTKCLKSFRSGYGLLVKGRTKVSVTNMGIMNLYQIAFGDTTGGIKYNRTVIECTHPEKFIMAKEEDFEAWKLDNTFCYELRVSREKQKDIFKIMQDDLKRLFGYNVYEEYRTQKCLVLTADKNARMMADRSATPKIIYNAGGGAVINYPFADLFEMIQHYNQDKIILNETGITGNVAVTLQAQMNDIEALNEALKKYGLNLAYKNRQVKMLVIRDPVK